MILIISTSKELLHEIEFVKPIVDILKDEELLIEHYSTLSKEDIVRSEKVIICGTSVQDNQFMDDIERFSWIKEFKKPLLGICAGSQILGMIFGAVLKEGTEIGYYKETFDDFLGLKGEQEVFHLHNQYADFFSLGTFDVLAGKEIPQAVKHKKKPFYGVLFHPEVRQKALISFFSSF